MDAAALMEVQHTALGERKVGVLEGHCLPTQNGNWTAELAQRPALPNSTQQKGLSRAGPETPPRKARPTSPS